MQISLPPAVVQAHIPTASQPKDFDLFQRSCVSVLSKLTRLTLQQIQGGGGDGVAKTTRALLDLYDVDGLEPWLGATGRQATEVWFEAFVRGEYDQAWLVGSTILEQLIVNIIYTFQGPDKFIPFLVRDLVAVPCLAKSVDRTLIRVIKTLMGSPLTLNIRNLLWHGFITPRDQIPLDAYGAMLIVTTMSIAVGVRQKLARGLQIQHGGVGVPRTSYYFQQEAETGLGGFDVMYERVAFGGGKLPLLMSGPSEITRQDQDWDQVGLVLEAIMRESPFVTIGTVEQWISALRHLKPTTIGAATAGQRSSFMFVMASLPLLEHGLRLMYVRANRCKQDRTCALVAGEYYLTLDVILDEFVPAEYFEPDAGALKEYSPDAIPNRLFSELGPQATNLLQDLFLAAQGPRLRDRTSHGENNVYFTADIRSEPWFGYYLGVAVFLLTLDFTAVPEKCEAVAEETREWMRMYTERRFDEWSAIRKETARAFCVLLEYPGAVPQDTKCKEGEAEAGVVGDDITEGVTAAVETNEKTEWIILRLKPKLSVVFSSEANFDTADANLSTVQDRIRICLSAWAARTTPIAQLPPPNNNINNEEGDTQGMASNMQAWILIVQSIQAATEKVTTKMRTFLELQRQRQLSSRSRKQLEAMRPLVPGWLGMLAGCLALVEHFVLLAEDVDMNVGVPSDRKGQGSQGSDTLDKANDGNNIKNNKKKVEKGGEEKVAGSVADKSLAAEIQLRLAMVNFLNKFVSNFERVKLPMIEAAWLDLVKSMSFSAPAPKRGSNGVVVGQLAPTNGGVTEEMMDTTGSDKEESSGVITSIEMSMDISPEEPAATNTMDTVVDANEPPAATSESTNAEPIATEPTDNEPADAELTNTELNHAEPADVEIADAEPADTEPTDTEPADTETATKEQVMTDADTTEPINTTIVTDAVADNVDSPAIIATTTATGLSPSPQTAENGLSPRYTAAGVPTSSETGDDGPSTPMSGQSAVVATATPRPQPDTIDGRSTKTGYVYDVRMRFHQNIHGDHDHPEDPRRIWKIYEALKNAGCLTRMVKLPSREATQAELGLVHTEEHIQTITDTAKMDREQLLDVANSYNSIYLSAESAICARLSCGNLLELCSAVATGKVLNGVAIIRPPGHHAEPDEAGGFCLFNNVAIAARFLQKEHGLKKIFILDWDVHHGNGTQKAFLDDPDVVYCSIHRYDDGTFYPGDPVAAALDMIGVGKGRGKNINIPWPCSGMGDAEYIYAFHKVIMPIVYEFAPDFVLVSAGFDAAAGDHIGENLVSPAAYGHMTHMLKSLAGGKIVLALEGGYNLESIAVSGLACTKALLSDPIPALGSIIPNPACIQTIHEVLEVQSRYWRSITPTFIDPTEEKQEGWNVVELSKVLGVYRSDFLYKEHRMLKLPISNASYGPDFLDNVHCTQQLYSTKPLYIFIHNVGEFRARTMGANNILRPDKSKMLDTVAHYVERIVQSGNELIDIVVPYQPATEDDKEPLKDKLSELLCDIWDNFVYMTGDTRRIVLLATGFGCYSMISFMNERQKDVARYVSCAVVVPGGDEAVPMVTRRLANWYMEHSFVVVADDHPVWERVNQKMSNRTGNIVRSGRPSERLSESLPRLYNTLFLEIERRIKALPPLDPPNYMLDLQEPPSNSSNNRNGVNDGMAQ
ncbi:Histone deacetylase hda1 [Mortierella sp. GBA39]|nr:Histone deacetylase hda1 [Mortierella sp. GBA39]